MPTITQLPFDPRAISMSVERDAQRSQGIHLSTILKDMLITAGINRAGRSGKVMAAAEQHMIFEQGFLGERLIEEYISSPENQAIEWDRFVTKGLQQLTTDAVIRGGGSLVRPGECCMDGIFMTPDAANLRLWHIEEWKATGIRSTNFSIPERRIEWLWQVAAYARFYKMTRGVIRVWHYGQLPAAVTQWVLEWTPDEIESNWEAVLKHWDYMQGRSK